MVWTAFFFLVGGSFAGAAWFAEQNRLASVDPDTHCFVHQDAPQIEVLAFDTSDPLVSAQARSVSETVRQSLDALDKGGLLAVVEIDPAAPTEIEPTFELCKPGADGNVERRQREEEFVSPVLDAVAAMGESPEADASPIVEAVVAIAGDQSLRPEGTPITIRLFTDGLQNSALWSSYDTTPRPPTPRMETLQGVTVEIVLLRNSRDVAYQAEGAAALAQWLRAAGATVRYVEPPWMALMADISGAHP